MPNRLGGLQRMIGRNGSRLGGSQKSLPADYMSLMSGLNVADRQSANATYALLIRRCGVEKAISNGRRVHAHVTASGNDRNTFLASLLVQMYGKCGSLKDARNVFNTIDHRDTFSWNSMIAAYGQNGHHAEALQLSRHMQMEGVKQDKFTFFPLLSASASLRALAEGKSIHERILAFGLTSNVDLMNSLVNMYGKCGSLKNACAVFGEMHERDVVSWNVMIAAYAQNGRGKEAFELFRQMELQGVKPSRTTFLTALGACISLSSLENGRAIHERIAASGFESDVTVSTALVNMYGKCGSLKDARAIFDKMNERNMISWTAMIAAYSQNGCGKEALELFRQMELEGVQPNKITFLSTLEACANLASLENGKAIHERIVASGFESDIYMKNALVNMYGKCGVLKNARAIFDEMTERNVISWTAMIAAYAQNGRAKEALKLFKQMDLEGIKPNWITFLTTLEACATLASLETGKAIHEQIVASGCDLDVSVRNALVNMYGKCGVLEDAREVFDNMDERNVISWTAMIAAYAQNGHVKEALELFREMVLEGIKPSNITFLSILKACSHGGLLDLGRHYFVSMSGDYGIIPSEKHHACMGDLLSRAGCLDEAEDLIINMPVQSSAVSWTILLGACRLSGDVERASRVAEHVFELDPENATPYILLSNIYSAAGRWDDAANVRNAMEERALKKKLGCCWIEVEGTVHDFFVGDTSHPQLGEIYEELKRLSRQMEDAGYVPGSEFLLHDVAVEETEHSLCGHNERLAIAFGLLSTLNGTPLRIVKNYRVCSDCHAATKFISKTIRRAITVRDANRFHHFQHGVCSCGDYW